MNEDSSEKDKYDFKVGMMGLGLLIGSPVVILILSIWGHLLWILAFVVTFGIPSIGVFLIIRSNYSGDRESEAVNREIEAMVNDASFDVSEQIIFWDKLKFSKGIGTQLEGREEEISEIYRRLMNARDELSAAETPRHQLEAVLAADSILATTRSLT
ncbi:hypothetical protein CATRI_06355 [Corynebacterium atrinae]|uniref:hypothetical protein n=1 Tax=Corynebacterium atrinae TaxID=1336740 RepID=UPI0025B40DE0|nr:hypothetical protein [Corynebacterium atrinae]WJY63355.1 hypothetical protein CATRI_06355 [Corynebacterium atrinae]